MIPERAMISHPSVRAVLAQPAVVRAFAAVDALAVETTREQITICEIAAPPFGEQARAEFFRRRFCELGLEAVHLDPEGNVIGLRPGRKDQKVVVVSAHLDTIFPDTEIRVRSEGRRLYAPGISDNAVGLAGLLAIVKVLNRAEVTTGATLVFLATVGEEGEGNLRGVRHFFLASDWGKRVAAFLALEGSGIERIISRALGSRRYRITFRGPGGHSWGDFGASNPIHALAQVAARLLEYPLPETPPTSLSITRITGGEAINAIPREASMDLDVRSVASAELEAIEAFLHRSVRTILEQQRPRRASSGGLRAEIERRGERPAAEVSPDADIVRIAIEATHAVGALPSLECASTDANIPIALGIPALAIGVGGSAGNVHTLSEWFDPQGREQGLKRALLMVLALAGLE